MSSPGGCGRFKQECLQVERLCETRYGRIDICGHSSELFARRQCSCYRDVNIHKMSICMLTKWHANDKTQRRNRSSQKHVSDTTCNYKVTASPITLKHPHHAISTIARPTGLKRSLSVGSAIELIGSICSMPLSR